MKAKITFTEEILGTASADPKIHEAFIASKSADRDKAKQEIESLPAEDLIEKAVTVFHRDDDGTPMVYDYQVKGFLKEAIGILIELAEKETKVGKTKVSKWTFKRIVDNYIMVDPRKIRLAPTGAVCVRPLRADTMKGERASLASSETVPAGTTFEVDIKTLSASLDDLVRQALDYGALKGMGQWRNSGKGRFTWEEIT